MIIELLVVVSIAVNIALAIAVRNMLLKTEVYEDFVNELKAQLQHVLGQIRSADIRGSFESDDEVGITFKAIKGMIETLDKFLLVEEP